MLVTGLVVWLSLSSTAAVSERADRFVATEVPQLRAIGALQDAVHRRTLSLYLYYATLDAAQEGDGDEVRAAFAQHLWQLETLSAPPSELVAFGDHMADFDRHAELFHEEMIKGRARSWDTLRLHLANAQVASDALNDVLMSWAESIRQTASEGGTQTLSQIGHLNRNQLGLSIVMAVVALFVLAITRARLRDQDELYRQAYFHPLTGLPNRSRLQADWHAEDGPPQCTAGTLLVISLDRYRMMTGTFGHGFGNEVVVAMTERIQTALTTAAAGGQLYQFGQSTWAVSLPGDETHAAKAAAALLSAGEITLSIRERELAVSCSIGACHYPEHGATIDRLLRNCDSSLREAQSAGGGTWRTYEAQLTERMERFLSTEQALRRGLAEGELELFFQPKRSASTLECTGAEALLRWRRNGQFVSPGEFIPVAEESGLILPIGRWVIEEACRHWRGLFEIGAPALPVAVNVSAQQFQASGFVEHVEATLARFEIPPVMLELEITEEATFGDEQTVIETLHALRAVGVRLAIDDFGTGYSSLAYLTAFPIDVLKIDQRFIQNLDNSDRDRSIVRMVAAMAQQLGFETVAEGVETQGQADLVRKFGCDVIQGYVYSRPLPAEDYRIYLEAHASDRSAA